MKSLKSLKSLKKSKQEILNPFSPNFGQLPESILDREGLVSSYIGTLSGKSNSPEWTTIFSGIRGSGKTVLLGEIAEQAKKEGWIVLKITAGGNLQNESLAILSLESKKGNFDISGLSVGFFGFSAGVNFNNSEISSWRTKIMEYLDKGPKNIKGILICVDEVQKLDNSLRTLAIDYQNLLQDKYKIAMVMAGLPHAISDVINDTVLTFLRRSNQIFLSGIEYRSVLNSYNAIFSKNGFNLSKDNYKIISKMTSGYPYLYQLIGYYAFEICTHKENDEIDLTSKDIEIIKEKAENRMAKSVLEPIINSLSEKDKDFLRAMSIDDGKSKIADVSSRTGMSKSYLSQYRKRLLESGLITDSERGYVNFAVPLLREYMRKPFGMPKFRGFQDMNEYGE
ncbi:MAG: ATP-binding protein [Candidatus Ancillula sp.]|jgi:DNA-binding transcriptional ArsR family regulator/nucleoside-triphosphatase THEP1|nr:ATP-binding protein [Candidatus Ancillula sp.]